MELFINGIGAVSVHAGFENALSLLESDVQVENGKVNLVEPDYKTFIPPAQLRRMSKIIKMGISASKLALANAHVEMPDAIITATGLGCLDDTEKFVLAIDENEEKLLTPTPFIQSTHNTVGGQIALLLNCHNYNYTYVHRGHSLESALVDASLQPKEYPSILVGAMDEFTPNSYSIMKKLGVYGPTCAAGEGAYFFALSNQKTNLSFSKISLVQTFFKSTEAKEFETNLMEYLTSIENKLTDVDLLFLGDIKNSKVDGVLTRIKETFFQSVKCFSFKENCGESPTANGYALALAARILEQNKASIKKIALLNQFVGEEYSLMLVENV